MGCNLPVSDLQVMGVPRDVALVGPIVSTYSEMLWHYRA